MSDHIHRTAVELTNAYLKAVLPESAGPIQTEETKRAFMAGFFNCFRVFNDMTDLDDDTQLRSIERYDLEMRGWAQTQMERAEALRAKLSIPR